MKNVKHYLTVLDKEKLIEGYYDLAKENIFEVNDKNMSIQQFEDTYKRKISNFLDNLINTEITIGEKGIGIIFAHRLGNILTGFVDVLVYENELKDEEKYIDMYEYTTLPNSEVLGFLISEDEFTQDHIYDLISKILYNTSSYGFTDFDKEKYMKKFNKIIGNIGNDYVKPKIDIEKSLDIDLWKLMNNIMTAIVNYNKYAYKKEFAFIRNQLKI